MANAIGVAAFLDRFVQVSVPIYVAGACPKSSSAEGARHGHVGEVADRKFLAADTVAKWPREVPFLFSRPTIWAASLISALEATGRRDLRAKLRLDRLYAACAVFHPDYRERVDVLRPKHSVSGFGYFLATCWVWWQRVKARARNLAQKAEAKFRDDRRIVGLEDCDAVVAFLADKFKRRPFDAALSRPRG
jgi:hypothetical protein